MIRVNLLPHREARRKQQQQQFFILLAFVAIIGAASWFSVHTYLSDRLQEQQSRNAYLEQEIVKLDKQIAEIKKLQEQTAALLARKKVVETLQSNRAEVVHLLDQLVRQLPDGIYLKGIKQKGNVVTISGYTQSQARVSTLMRNLESSNHLESPGLIEIKAVQLSGQRINEFTMNINIMRAKAEEDSPKRPRGRPAKG
ncbi:MAG: PilN domain-containing protein [Betaproteobacteria bacterium]|nr:MAG: fimbrial protein [Betaproteobacteria bacterium SG8_41]UCF76882.1 MAG: PilN domain-containing protein [Betaproteobacteria bacterium]